MTLPAKPFVPNSVMLAQRSPAHGDDARRRDGVALPVILKECGGGSGPVACIACMCRYATELPAHHGASTSVAAA